jgi:hypothetical protein
LWHQRIDKGGIVPVIFLCKRKTRNPCVDWIDVKWATDVMSDVKAVWTHVLGKPIALLNHMGMVCSLFNDKSISEVI